VSLNALPDDVTGLRKRVADGDEQAAERLAEVVYADLRRLASSFLAGERQAHTLEPAALVHEAWMRVLPATSQGLAGRGHFMALAARAMRQILVDHARSRRRHERGGDWQRVSLSVAPAGTNPQARMADLIDIDAAIEHLAAEHPRAARVVELRAFAGLTIAEAAEALVVADSTVEEDWALAKAWLSRALRRR
jgi:RNA polymerase sigma factor (TIGR02999 family)